MKALRKNILIALCALTSSITIWSNPKDMQVITIDSTSNDAQTKENLAQIATLFQKHFKDPFYQISDAVLQGCFLNGSVMGFISYRDTLFKKIETRIICHMAIDSSYQRKGRSSEPRQDGYGTTLMKLCENDARNKGIKQLMLTIYKDENIDFYTKMLGFTLTYPDYGIMMKQITPIEQNTDSVTEIAHHRTSFFSQLRSRLNCFKQK